MKPGMAGGVRNPMHPMAARSAVVGPCAAADRRRLAAVPSAKCCAVEHPGHDAGA